MRHLFMRRLLFAFAMTAACTCFVQASLAAEQPVAMSDPVTIAPPEEYQPQYFPRAAYSAAARCYLVVWQEGPPTGDGAGPGQSIRAVRVSEHGQVLDTTPIVVCAQPHWKQRPAVAADGQDFLIVWQDFSNGQDWDVRGARISAEGKLRDNAGGFLVSGGRHNQCLPELVFAGDRYVAAWLDMRHWPEYRVYATRIDRDGQVADVQGVELIRVMNDQEMAAWKDAPPAPGKLGLGWHNFGVKGTSGIKQPGPPALAANDQVCVVASEIQGESSTGIAVAALDLTGGATNRAWIIRRTKLGYLHWSRPALAATGDGFLLATHLGTGSWGSGPGFWVTSRLHANGTPASDEENAFTPTVIDTRTEIPPGYRSYGNRQLVLGLASAPGSDGRYLFLCERHRHSTETPGNINVLGVFVDSAGRRLADPSAAGSGVAPDRFQLKGPGVELPSGAAVEPFPIAEGEAPQSAPAVAAGPSGSFLVVWQEEPAEQDSRIVARIVRTK